MAYLVAQQLQTLGEYFDHRSSHVKLIALKFKGPHLKKFFFVSRAWALKAGGTGGRVPRSQKISGGRPPRNDDILASFSSHR